MIRLVKFYLIGVVNSVAGFALIFGCMGLLHWNPYVSNFIGYAAGMAISYTLNRRWNFKSQQKVQQEAPRFLSVTLFALGLNLLLLRLLIGTLGCNPYLAQILSAVVYTSVSFVLCRALVFRQPKTETPENLQERVVRGN